MSSSNGTEYEGRHRKSEQEEQREERKRSAVARLAAAITPGRNR